MMGNIHIQPYNPEYIGVLHIFGDFKVDKFPSPLIAYLHVDTLHIEKRNKRKRSFCNTRQSICSIIQVVSCMRAQRWRSNAAPRFSSAKRLRLVMGLNPSQIRPYPYFKSPNYHPLRPTPLAQCPNPKSRWKMICDLRADLLP